VRASIHRAAVQLFGDQGFDATSIQEIAARAGVTKPMVYYYFKSKTGLLRAILEEAREQFSTQLQQAATQEALPVAERVLALLRIQAQTFHDRPALNRFFHRILFTDPPRAIRRMDRVQIKEIAESLQRIFRALAEQGVARGELKGDPEIIAALLHSLFNYSHMLSFVFADEPGAAPRPWGEKMLQTLLQGIGQPP
jgi:AcrR family transcriptional regulator